MPTKVQPNCVDIFQEEVDFKSPISEGLLTKMAAAINASCESLTPRCTLDTTAGTRTYQALPGSKFLMIFGVGGGGGGGGVRTDILDHNTGSGALTSGTAPTAGFENGLPGSNTIFNGQAVGRGGRGGGEALGYAIAQKRTPPRLYNSFSGTQQLLVSLHFHHGHGFGRRQTAPDNDGYSPLVEELVLSANITENYVWFEKHMDSRGYQLGEDGHFLNGTIAGGGGNGGNYAVTFSANGTLNSETTNTASMGTVRLLGGGGQSGQLGVHTEKSIPNAVYTYTVGAGGDNGGVTNVGTDTIGTGTNPAYRVIQTSTTTANATDGNAGGILIVDWGHS